MPLNDEILMLARSQQNITQTLQSLVGRLTRIETRLTQLMVFEGMQSDGRAPLTHRGGQAYVG